MPLAPGHRLGPYEVVGPLGAGGMGEVYKARDTRLDRTVALKVIQPAAASSPEMRERFEREARAISALDHPHICVLYDVCRENETSFLVMQYLEGETLADRLARAGKPASDPSRPSSGADTTIATISRGPIPFETTLKYAAEIAQALDAAHRRGIVHRDLKPGNVMLTKTGTKLLDFGLAKLAANDAGLGGLDGATRTSPFGAAQGGPLTGQGAILGTLHYMSPEQLEGREVDTRSDIHAFGALLFEMLSGRRAFESQSQAGIISAIIGGDPPALTALVDTRTTLPIVAQRALDRLLAKCLAKDPDDRWQSAADLAAELKWIGEERLRAVPESAVVAPAASVAVAGSRLRERIWMATAGVAVVALAGLAYSWYPRPTPPAEQVTFTIDAPAGQTMAAVTTGPGFMNLSPSGTRVAFVTRSAQTNQTAQLWIRTLGSLEPRRIDRADGAWQPVWSPDEKSIAFAASGGAAALRKIDLATGALTNLAPSVVGRAAWGRTGVILFEADDRKLYRVSDSGGGTPSLAMDLDATRHEVELAWPTFLPDGRRYLFAGRSSEPDKTGLFLASLDAPGRTFLVNVLSSVDYAGGHLFYQREGILMAHPFDAAAGRLTGEAFPVIQNVVYNQGNGRAAFSVSETGVLAYLSGDATNVAAGRTLTILDRSSKASKPVGSAGSYVGAALSPDSQRAVITIDANQSTRTLSLLDIDRGLLTPLNVENVNLANAVWDPDGSSVVFGALRDSSNGVYRRSAGGGATSDQKLFSSSESVVPTGFSQDGSLLLMTVGAGPRQRIWVLPVTGQGQAVEAFPGATMAQQQATFSPDGKWIAYASGPGPGETEVYVQPYPADDRRIQVSSSGGRHPYWTVDSRHIVYRAIDDAIRSVELTPDGRTLRPSAPVTLFTQKRAARNNWSFSMDKTAQKFLFILPPETPEAETPAPLTMIVNWVANLKHR